MFYYCETKYKNPSTCYIFSIETVTTKYCFTHVQNALLVFLTRTFSMREELPGMTLHFHPHHMCQREAQTSVKSHITHDR